MRSILVHADNDPACDDRLQVALDLARRFQGHVTLLIATPLQQFVSFDPFGGTYFAAEALAAAQADDIALETRLADRLAAEDVPWDILMADGDTLVALAGAATFADLAVVSLPPEKEDRRGGPPAMLAGDLAVTARTPVLALPRGAWSQGGDAPAMVAWNGSAQAAHALRAAVPLLAGRPAVLVTIGGDDGDFPATDALRYLSRHDIHAELETIERGGDTVEEQLEKEALAMGAGLIVMGAFGRSRLRETMFGGVTQHLLTSAHVPLLLAH